MTLWQVWLRHPVSAPKRVHLVEHDGPYTAERTLCGRVFGPHGVVLLRDDLATTCPACKRKAAA